MSFGEKNGFEALFLFTLRGPPRRPPPQVQDQVKSLNQSLRLGHLLCRSRNPDFLLNIIQRQVRNKQGGKNKTLLNMVFWSLF